MVGFFLWGEGGTVWSSRARLVSQRSCVCVLYIMWVSLPKDTRRVRLRLVSEKGWVRAVTSLSFKKQQKKDKKD